MAERVAKLESNPKVAESPSTETPGLDKFFSPAAVAAMADLGNGMIDDDRLAGLMAEIKMVKHHPDNVAAKAAEAAHNT